MELWANVVVYERPIEARDEICLYYDWILKKGSSLEPLQEEVEDGKG